MMLRGNLSTKPFYNERAVSIGLALLALVVIALTVFNFVRVTELSARRSALRQQMSAEEAQAAQIRAEASAVQGSVDRSSLQGLATATRLANDLITARTFSWTTFFGYVEDTIPFDVRLTAVSPEVEKGEIVITMLMVGRTATDIDTFAKRLEDTGAFYDVTFVVADTTEDGLLRVTVRAVYFPPKTDGTAPVRPGGRP